MRQRCTEIAENEIMAEEDVVTIDNMLKEHGEAITDIYYDQEENNVIYQEDLQRFYQRRAEEREGHMTRPARGLTQKFKKGIKDALAVMDKVKDVAKWTSRRMVLEIFAGTAMVTQVAEESTPWGAYQPIDIIMGEEWDLSVAANRKHVVNLVSSLKPALVVITPPCGPWCAWQRLCQDFDALDELRRKHLPYWRLTRDIWDCQTREGRLALTEQPDGSDALETSYMTGRNPLYRVVVDQCMFGLKDPESHKLYRKTTLWMSMMRPSPKPWPMWRVAIMHRRSTSRSKVRSRSKGNGGSAQKWHRLGRQSWPTTCSSQRRRPSTRRRRKMRTCS